MKKDLFEIAENWKLEARQEDNQRYFFHTKEAEKILNGNKYYVIGRKGSGKSAISEYIVKKNEFNIFTEKLSFKNFPFNELYTYENPKYTYPNQYITIWKYIIYSNICKLMAKNENIDSNIRKILVKLYPSDSVKSLSRMIEKWMATEFGASVFGTGGNIKLEKEISNFSNISWIDKTNFLEDIIYDYVDESKYFIVFDELDEDYRVFRDKNELEQYVFLMTSLFKAVQDIKAIFQDKKNIINPVIFLRDDIYSLIKDADKNKWGDFKIELEWNEHKIKAMLAFRLSKVKYQDTNNFSFEKIWNEFFINKPVHMGDGGKKTKKIFDYITLSTHLRPRDYIKYIQECAKQTYNDGYDKIHPKTVKKVDKGFSNYMKDEIVDEIYVILPEIQEIFSIISQIRKWTFTIDEFKKTYNKYIENGTIKEENVDFVLQTLFDFGVIGNRPKNRTISFFKYENKEARFNFNENIVVHRGLFKSLQIL